MKNILSRKTIDGFTVSVCLFLLANPAFATPPTGESAPEVQPTPADQSETTGATGSTGFLSGLSRSDTLLGDMGGLRTLLSRSAT
jgi:hypothetical protein